MTKPKIKAPKTLSKNQGLPLTKSYGLSPDPFPSNVKPTSFPAAGTDSKYMRSVATSVDTSGILDAGDDSAESPMNTTLNNLEGSVEILRGMIMSIRSRLHPVLLSQPVGDGSDFVEAPAGSPVQNRIQSVSNEIQIMTDDIRNTINALSI